MTKYQKNIIVLVGIKTSLGGTKMRQKVGTILEEDLVKRLRMEAAREGKPINRIMEEALRAYLNRRRNEGNTSLVIKGWGVFRVNPKELKKAFEADVFDS